ncbi:MAG: 16S rRNA (cytosine(1402)-N(4))-methyltransferase RsmH [Bacteroidota bacterium]
MDNEQKPPRRVRYKGTHPKTFKEKYKELQPEKYAADIEKVKQKGNTPAGMHRSICVDEIIECLQLAPGQTGLDATLGFGGHSLEILKRITPDGKLFAVDVDPFELPRTLERLTAQGFSKDVLEIRKMNFSEIDHLADEAGGFDFVLADLGVSSMQIDNPERGFSLKVDGPLDLRLDPSSGKSAAQLLKNMKQEKLESILVENADEPHAAIIAEAIVSSIKNGNAIGTTSQLKNIIGEALKSLPQGIKLDDVKKCCQRCFQALRIEVNDEFGVLEKFLAHLPDALKPGGRVAILSFHSGEDRRVKKAFQFYSREGIFSEVVADPVRPNPEEIFSNPRARSAKLRWAVKA